VPDRHLEPAIGGHPRSGPASRSVGASGQDEILVAPLAIVGYGTR
jgi:hypothetical protein